MCYELALSLIAWRVIYFFKAILERTGYTLDVTTGQRKYGGPPPNWEGNTPGSGCEVIHIYILSY